MNECKSCLGTNGGHFQHCEQYRGSNPKKVQCTTASQCLKELARVMEQFGIDNPITASKSKYVRYAQEHWSSMPVFSTPSDWSFAIAEVEGKPVFVGDILWCVSGALNANGYSFKAGMGMDFDKTVWSFNPSKPKTIMIELLVEDAKFLAGIRGVSLLEAGEIEERKLQACRQALEREGVE